jgi:hypothetical protein
MPLYGISTITGSTTHLWSSEAPVGSNAGADCGVRGAAREYEWRQAAQNPQGKSG